MLGVLHAEALKAWKRPANWICFGLLLLLLVALGYALSYFIFTYTKPTATRGPQLDYKLLKQVLYPAHFHQQAMSVGQQLGGVIVMIIGVLIQGSEYGWGTIKTAFTQRPRRWVVIAGRLVVLAAMALAVAVTMFVLAAATSWLLATIDGKSTAFPSAETTVKALLALWLIFLFWGGFGFVLATLFRQSALAIGLGLAYALVIEALAFGIGDQFGGNSVRQVHQWFPIANTGYLVQSFGSAAPPGATAEAPVKPFADATHAVVVLVLYCVAFVAASVGLTERRDVAS